MNFLVIENAVINPDNQENIKQMRELALRSYRRNLLGDWEIIVLDGDFSNLYEHGSYVANNAHFQDAYKRIKRLWSKGNSILFISADTLCVKPTRVFGEFQNFGMFWHTDPKSAYGFERYLNSGITYFPMSMSPIVWEVGDLMWKNMELDQSWDKSQIIYNHMFYSQDMDYQKYMRNELHWATYTENEIPKEEAHILHYHGSRGVGSALEQMRKDFIW